MRRELKDVTHDAQDATYDVTRHIPMRRELKDIGIIASIDLAKLMSQGISR